jgi:protein tyrosine/serine phosphatase
MLRDIADRLDRWERNLRRSFGDDISTPAKRRQAWWHYQLMDHAFLRSIWTNLDTVAPGVYRSNQPTRARFERMKALGVRTVINLRGTDRFAHYLFEQEICAELGLRLVDLRLWARKAAPAENILAVIDAFRTVERPFLMHCKSGADRAGFASAVYLMTQEGRSVEEARRHLALRYLHLRWSKTGILDHTLAVYAQRQRDTAIGFEDWLRQEYDPEAVSESFRATPRWRR